MKRSVGGGCYRSVFEKRLEGFENVGEDCCREVLGKSVGEECWRRVLEKSVVESCCGEVLEKSLGEGCWRRVLEVWCREV